MKTRMFIFKSKVKKWYEWPFSDLSCPFHLNSENFAQLTACNLSAFWVIIQWLDPPSPHYALLLILIPPPLCVITKWMSPKASKIRHRFCRLRFQKVPVGSLSFAFTLKLLHYGCLWTPLDSPITGTGTAVSQFLFCTNPYIMWVYVFGCNFWEPASIYKMCNVPSEPGRVSEVREARYSCDLIKIDE